MREDFDPARTSPELPRRVRPLRDASMAAGGYALVAVTWIVLSDLFLGDGVSTRFIAAEMSKGVAFVAVTAAALFWMTSRYLTRLRDSEARYVLAQEDLRRKDLAVRQGYVDVLDAVTGGKLILLTEDELAASLGDVLLEPQPLGEASGLSAARRQIAGTLCQFEFTDHDAVMLAVSEALTNSLKHAGSAEYEIRRTDDYAQVVVRDSGPGIDFRALPKATLIQGFSTTNTMGMGFTIMLEVSDRVLLTTGAEGTTVALELAIEGTTSRPSHQPTPARVQAPAPSR